jgi:hypothetical protein
MVSGIESAAWGVRPLWQREEEELLAVLAEDESVIRQHYAAMLDVVSELDSRGAAGKLGYSNTAGVLVHTLRITRKDALRRIAQAEDLHDTHDLPRETRPRNRRPKWCCTH